MTTSLFCRLTERARRLSARSRAVGMFFATSLAARGLGIGCQLLQVPLALQALGPEGFGLWMTLTSLGMMITFADFGLGQGAQNKLAEAFARGRPAEARTLWEGAFVFLAGTGGLLLAAALAIAHRIDAAALFNLTDPVVRAGAPRAVQVMIVLFCLNFPLGLAQRLASARQLGWMHNVAQAAASIGALGGTILGVALHWSLPGIVAAAQTPLVLGNLASLALQLRQLGWVRPIRLRGHGRTIRELIGLGSYFGVQQVQLVLFATLPPVIISLGLGAAAVTPYNLVQRLFNVFAVAQNAFMLPLWPAYSDAHARGEFGWIRRMLGRSLAATLLITIAPMAAGTVVGRPLIDAWIGTGAGAQPSLALLWLLFGWNALVFLQQPFGFMLAGLSVVRRQTFFSVVSMVLGVALMLVLARQFGAEGVVAGMILGFLPFLLFGNVAETARVLRMFPANHPSAGAPATL